MRTILALATAAAVAALVSSQVQAATKSTEQTKPATTKHTTTMHKTMHKQHQASLRTHGGRMARNVANPRDVNANLNLSNANASANRPVESLATQLGATVTKSGSASDPVCKPGDIVPMPDGRSYPCQ
jgi:hypothetical protein